MTISYVTGDDSVTEALEKLYADVFNKKLSLEGMRQWYIDNPISEVGEYISKYKNDIAAYNYFYPQLHNDIKVLLSGGSLGNPIYPGMFLFSYLYLQEKLKDEKISLLYGFPNRNSFPIFVGRAGCQWLELKSYRLLNIKKNTVERCVNNAIFTFDMNVETLDIDDRQLHYLSRDKKWLMWRIRKPGNSYRIAKFLNRYIIFKPFGENIDIMSVLNCTNIVEYVETLSYFYQCFTIDNDVRMMNVMVTTEELLYEMTRFFEFDFDLYERHLCYRQIDESFGIDKSEMFFEMIDSDVF